MCRIGLGAAILEPHRKACARNGYDLHCKAEFGEREIAFQLAPFGNGAVCPGWPQQHFAAVEIHLYVGTADAGAASEAQRHLPVEPFGARRPGGAKNRTCTGDRKSAVWGKS